MTNLFENLNRVRELAGLAHLDESSDLGKRVKLAESKDLHKRLLAVTRGKKIDADLENFLNKLDDGAVDTLLTDVQENPYDYSIDGYDADDIAQMSNISVSDIYVCDNSFVVGVHLDLDDLGGSSDNTEYLAFDIEGKFKAKQNPTGFAAELSFSRSQDNGDWQLDS